MPWQDEAACLNYPAEWWDDSKGRKAITEEHVKAARICRTECPVIAECRAARFPVQDEFVIRAGLYVGRARTPAVPEELQAHGRPVGVPDVPRGDPACGSIRGHERHRRLGEPICRECRDAKSAYDHERYLLALAGPCGTAQAFRAHLRAKQEPCEDCRKAWEAAAEARRLAYERRQPKTPAPSCECGCGQTVVSFKGGVWARTRRGHNMRPRLGRVS